MLYASIGLLVGIVMGLTGAGGAMISIPLFIYLLNTSLKEATVLSLVAVMLGTSINLMNQLSRVNKTLVLTLALSGIVANYHSLLLKASFPDLLVAITLTMIGIYSLWSIWKKQKELSHTKVKHLIPKAIIAGSFIGILTTLTGLGGGVVLVPLLINMFHTEYENALPTSLGTIFLISLTSFVFQSKLAFDLINPQQLALMTSGVLVAYMAQKIMTSKLDLDRMLMLRKTVFTAVTIYSIIVVMLKAL